MKIQCERRPTFELLSVTLLTANEIISNGLVLLTLLTFWISKTDPPVAQSETKTTLHFPLLSRAINLPNWLDVTFMSLNSIPWHPKSIVSRPE